ncbi:MAG: divalent-cation tolerance protein CutA [Nitrospinae bacterium]|nr:divalent-cation tolerance protein CutA [Nitrospinota bacterium]MBI3813854.1 divalent-cation tolerance protein CutA [Nitrospinota bacterium]
MQKTEDREQKTDFVVIFITAGSIEEAEKIGKGLVEEKLAACANIIQPIKSIFFWEGKLCEEKEALMVVKSKPELFKPLMDYVKKNHSYKVPEIIAVPIIDGLPDYLTWVGESCKKGETKT